MRPCVRSHGISDVYRLMTVDNLIANLQVQGHNTVTTVDSLQGIRVVAIHLHKTCLYLSGVVRCNSVFVELYRITLTDGIVDMLVLDDGVGYA